MMIERNTAVVTAVFPMSDTTSQPSAPDSRIVSEHHDVHPMSFFFFSGVWNDIFILKPIRVVFIDDVLAGFMVDGVFGSGHDRNSVLEIRVIRREVV